METISDLKRMGASLYLTCSYCRHKVTLGPDEAFKTFSPFQILSDIPRIARCSNCKAKGVGIILVDYGMPG